MLSTVDVVDVKHDPAKGVLVSVTLSTLLLAMKVKRIVKLCSELVDDGRKRIYHVIGQLFFVSSHVFNRGFDFTESIDRIEIEFTHAPIDDISSISALD